MYDAGTCKKKKKLHKGDLCCEDPDKKLKSEIDRSISRWKCHYIVCDVS